MLKFEIIDHTADAGLVAYGATRKETFVNAAVGMFSMITNLEEVDCSHQQEIAIEADDYEELLVTWLNELLYLFDVESLLFRDFNIVRLEHNKLAATACGEKIDPLRHELKTQIKAATYHKLKLEKEEDGFSAQLILDV